MLDGIRSRTPRPAMSMPFYSLLLYLATCIAPCLAQTNKLFQWGFSSNSLSTSLPTCLPLPIIVKSFDPTTNSTHGTPPYYMIAFAIGGTPITTLIGTDENNLSWMVTHPVGSQLILSVVDANGSAGGVPPNKMTVIAGQTTQCVTTPVSTPPFTVTANVTKVLQTCQPWGFTVKGGVPPYIITLAAPNSPIVTNVTLPFGDDAFTYINRANPDGQLMGAISDFTGRWATGTPIVDTQGSTDVSCTGLVSSSGNATIIKQENDAANAAASAHKRRRSIIIGISVTLALLVLFGLIVATFFWTRRRERLKEEEEAKLAPHQFVALAKTPDQVLSINSDLNSSSRRTGKAGSAADTSQAASSPPQGSTPAGSSPSNSDPTSNTSNASPTGTNADTQSTSGFATFPTTSIRRNRKAAEAGYTAQSPDSEHLETVPSPVDRAEEEGEIVFQHRDGGRPVRELPPPYLDRVGADRSSPS